jgi:uncharacterized protein YjbI with pentapeptide repeats
MADFTHEDLAGSRFEDVDLTGARFRNVDLTGAVIRGALVVNVDIDGLRYPEPESFPVRRCLGAILNEEWEHRLFAERDLDVLESRGTP